MLISLERLCVTATFVLSLLGVATGAMAQTKPVPLINQPLVPDAVAPGGPAFILTVNGTGFVNKSVVEWNGGKRTTTVVSHSQLTATISARDIATAGTAWVTVVNPAPTGGTSNVAFLSITNSTTTVGFRKTSHVFSGPDAEIVVAADFNGDGKLDLAVGNEYVNKASISILLGDGAGNFTLASSVAAGPGAFAVGDFNGDGKPDLAVGNDNTGSIAILLGDGTGHFTQVSTINSEQGPFAVGDFNGDGNLDLVVNGSVAHTIFLGDGTGNFTQGSSFTVNDAGGIVVGDFNGDGNLDLAVTSVGLNEVIIFQGDGAGNFTQTASYPTGDSPDSLATGDFNGDGNLDLAIANGYSNNLTILLGDGTGNFTAGSSPVTPQGPGSIVEADFNGDGKLDLGVTTQCGIAVLLGDGTGGFTQASCSPLGEFSVAAGDFNSDGKADLAVAGSGEAIVIGLQVPAVTLSPASLTFDPQKVNTTSPPQIITVTNTGFAAVDFFGVKIDENNSVYFGQNNNCPASLAIGASCTISVTFAPVYGGFVFATLYVSDNGGNNPFSISLTGTGLSAKVSPKTLKFGDEMVGQTSARMTSTLTNFGSTTLGIYGLTLVGKDPGDFSISGGTCVPRGRVRIPPGGTCTVNVRFTPTQTGSRTATVNIADNGGGPPIKVSGTGTQ